MKNKMLKMLWKWQIQDVINQLMEDGIDCKKGRRLISRYDTIHDNIKSENREITEDEFDAQSERADDITEYFTNVILSNYE